MKENLGVPVPSQALGGSLLLPVDLQLQVAPCIFTPRQPVWSQAGELQPYSARVLQVTLHVRILYPHSLLTRKRHGNLAGPWDLQLHFSYDQPILTQLTNPIDWKLHGHTLNFSALFQCYSLEVFCTPGSHHTAELGFGDFPV